MREVDLYVCGLSAVGLSNDNIEWHDIDIAMYRRAVRGLFTKLFTPRLVAYPH